MKTLLKVGEINSAGWRFYWRRIDMRTFVVVSLVAGLVGCVSTRERPTSQMVAEQHVEKKTVTFTSDASVSTLADRLQANAAKCLGEKVTTLVTGVADPGIFVPVVTSMEQRLELGSSDGTDRWLALRMNGMIKLVAAAVKLTPRAEGSVVEVFPANKAKAAEIQLAVESGNYFCSWRGLDYPWD